MLDEQPFKVNFKIIEHFFETIGSVVKFNVDVGFFFLSQ